MKTRKGRSVARFASLVDRSANLHARPICSHDFNGNSVRRGGELGFCRVDGVFSGNVEMRECNDFERKPQVKKRGNFVSVDFGLVKSSFFFFQK